MIPPFIAAVSKYSCFIFENIVFETYIIVLTIKKVSNNRLPTQLVEKWVFILTGSVWEFINRRTPEKLNPSSIKTNPLVK